MTTMVALFFLDLSVHSIYWRLVWTVVVVVLEDGGTTTGLVEVEKGAFFINRDKAMTFT